MATTRSCVFFFLVCYFHLWVLVNNFLQPSFCQRKFMTEFSWQSTLLSKTCFFQCFFHGEIRMLFLDSIDYGRSNQPLVASQITRQPIKMIVNIFVKTKHLISYYWSYFHYLKWLLCLVTLIPLTTNSVFEFDPQSNSRETRVITIN